MGVIAVAFGGLVMAFVISLSHNPSAQVHLGDQVFEIGDAAGVGHAIERDGPLLFKDPLGRGRDLVITRAAGAFEAFEARTAPGCAIGLVRPAGTLRDCHGVPVRATARLRHYRTRVSKGRLTVDLRAPLPPP